MKTYKDGRLRFAAYDVETDSFTHLSIGDVVENPDVLEIESVRQALASVVDGQIQEVVLTASHIIA